MGIQVIRNDLIMLGRKYIFIYVQLVDFINAFFDETSRFCSANRRDQKYIKNVKLFYG